MPDTKKVAEMVALGFEIVLGLIGISVLVAWLLNYGDFSFFTVLFVLALAFGADRVRAAVHVRSIRPKKR